MSHTSTSTNNQRRPIPPSRSPLSVAKRTEEPQYPSLSRQAALLATSEDAQQRLDSENSSPVGSSSMTTAASTSTEGSEQDPICISDSDDESSLPHRPALKETNSAPAMRTVNHQESRFGRISKMPPRATDLPVPKRRAVSDTGVTHTPVTASLTLDSPTPNSKARKRRREAPSEIPSPSPVIALVAPEMGCREDELVTNEPNARDVDKERSNDSSPLPHARRAPKRTDALTVEDAMRDILRSPLVKRQDKMFGMVYILRSPSKPGLLKIGFTSRELSSRQKDIEAKCNKSLDKVYWPESPFKGAHRAEQLVHADLEILRRPHLCEGNCDHTHREWFEVEEDLAKKTVKRWTDFMQQKKPYKDTGFLRQSWANALNTMARPKSDDDVENHDARWARWSIIEPNFWGRCNNTITDYTSHPLARFLGQFAWQVWCTVGWVTVFFLVIDWPTGKWVGFSICGLTFLCLIISMVFYSDEGGQSRGDDQRARPGARRQRTPKKETAQVG